MSVSLKKRRESASGNTRRSNLTVCLRDGDGAEFKNLPESEIKKMVGAFKIESVQTIEEIMSLTETAAQFDTVIQLYINARHCLQTKVQESFRLQPTQKYNGE